MGFVKLDSGILDSTLWMARAQREVFITALLMAEPRELETPMEQLEVNTLKTTGFIVPPGWYGFVPAAGVGIIARALVAQKEGLDALEALGSPESWSRSQDFEGRRLVRVDGGFIVLNFVKYRDKDYTTAERSRRYRERKKLRESQRDNVTSRRDITQALALADKNPPTPLEKGGVSEKPNGKTRTLEYCQDCQDNGTTPQGEICHCAKGKEAAVAREVMGKIKSKGLKHETR